jgi:hypothetical protein
MATESFKSWGRLHSVEQESIAVSNRFISLSQPISNKSLTYLPYGNGRSYGDSCLNSGGIALKTRMLDRYINFDTDMGVLTCEAGILLSEILNLIVPQGWFLPVTPGTRFVTLGGAIANDVHGKNHHLSGTFGRHVRQLELLRSDGRRLVCSSQSNVNYFEATIGGLGLTGLITWAEIQLKRIYNPLVVSEKICYESLDEFFYLSNESNDDYEYTVSWIDLASKGKRFGRGVFMRGNHAPINTISRKYSPRVISFPLSPPISLIKQCTIKTINSVYYYQQLQQEVSLIQHYEEFFYPLDGILNWNRICGPRGFYQYQCVIPTKDGKDAISELMAEIGQSVIEPFLAVLKVFGGFNSPGMLSFPVPGVSLALDFSNCGDNLHSLFNRLDQIVIAANGRLYPAKDSRMPGSMFREGYLCWQDFTNYIDPHFSSLFWRLVMENT